MAVQPINRPEQKRKVSPLERVAQGLGLLGSATNIATGIKDLKPSGSGLDVFEYMQKKGRFGL